MPSHCLAQHTTKHMHVRIYELLSHPPHYRKGKSKEDTRLCLLRGHFNIRGVALIDVRGAPRTRAQRSQGRKKQTREIQSFGICKCAHACHAYLPLRCKNRGGVLPPCAYSTPILNHHSFLITGREYSDETMQIKIVGMVGSFCHCVVVFPFLR